MYENRVGRENGKGKVGYVKRKGGAGWKDSNGKVELV